MNGQPIDPKIDGKKLARLRISLKLAIVLMTIASLLLAGVGIGYRAWVASNSGRGLVIKQLKQRYKLVSAALNGQIASDPQNANRYRQQLKQVDADYAVMMDELKNMPLPK